MRQRSLLALFLGLSTVSERSTRNGSSSRTNTCRRGSSGHGDFEREGVGDTLTLCCVSHGTGSTPGAGAPEEEGPRGAALAGNAVGLGIGGSVSTAG